MAINLENDEKKQIMFFIIFYLGLLNFVYEYVPKKKITLHC